MQKNDRAQRLKLILDALIWRDQRDFTVRISKRMTKHRGASYLTNPSEIVVYRNERSWHKLFCYGVHELAHHVSYKHGNKGHGQVFTKNLDHLINVFNLLYRDTLHGAIEFDRRKPQKPPTWRKVNTTGISK